MVGVWQPTAVYLLIQPECEMLQVEDIAKLDVRSQQCVSDFSGWTEASKKGLIPAFFYPYIWMGFYSYMDRLMLQRKVPDSEFSVLPPVCSLGRTKT